MESNDIQPLVNAINDLTNVVHNLVQVVDNLSNKVDKLAVSANPKVDMTVTSSAVLKSLLQAPAPSKPKSEPLKTNNQSLIEITDKKEPDNPLGKPNSKHPHPQPVETPPPLVNDALLPTCTPWKGFPPKADHQRTDLVVWNRGCDYFPANSISKYGYNFQSFSTVSSDRYKEYLTQVFTEKERSRVYGLPPEYYLCGNLDLGISDRIIKSFPKLAHLSLVDVGIHPKTLIHLLKAFKLQLKSLFLRPILGYRGPCDDAFLRLLWPIIDSMVSLRQLSFCYFRPWPDFATVLPTVLPQLEEFQLWNYDGLRDVYPILMKLNGSKLKRLALDATNWHDEGMLSRLVRAKPALSQGLTHLKVHRIGNLTNKYASSYVNLNILKQIVQLFPRLEHLDIHIETTVSIAFTFYYFSFVFLLIIYLF